MKIDRVISPYLKHVTPALVIGCLEDSGDEYFMACNAALDGLLETLRATGAFKGAANSTYVVNTLGRLPAERLILVGVGKRKGLDCERIRQAAGSAATRIQNERIDSFATILHQAGAVEGALEAVIEGTVLGGYRFDRFKTGKRAERHSVDRMSLLYPDSTQCSSDIDTVISRTLSICDGVRLARDLVSLPGNVATTGYLADTAREISERYSMNITVLEKNDLEQSGFNALMAVGKGSAEPPRLIILEYRRGPEKEGPVVLVGKGVTFDSGGISIKPSAGMEEMKTDMAGAAAVLGTLSAAAALGLPLNLVGIIPAVENMPDGCSYRPGDVISTLSGTTVEVTNTDAEGRLILCDALHYAQRFKPRAVIDLATLTGACVVALGHEASGMMGNDQKLMRSLKESGDRCGERLWELPLWDSYGEYLKSDIADLKNAGSRDGGSITAGWFLKQFVGTARWSHLDIAGTAWCGTARPYIPKGATGVGVRLLVDYLTRLS